MENEIINNEVMEEVVDSAVDSVEDTATDLVKVADRYDWKAIGLGAAVAATVIIGGKIVVKKAVIPAAKWAGRKVKGLFSKKTEAVEAEAEVVEEENEE